MRDTERKKGERGRRLKEKRGIGGDIGEVVERVRGVSMVVLEGFFSKTPTKYETVSRKPQIFSRERDFQLCLSILYIFYRHLNAQ